MSFTGKHDLPNSPTLSVSSVSGCDSPISPFSVSPPSPTPNPSSSSHRWYYADVCDSIRRICKEMSRKGSPSQRHSTPRSFNGNSTRSGNKNDLSNSGGGGNSHRDRRNIMSNGTRGGYRLLNESKNGGNASKKFHNIRSGDTNSSDGNSTELDDSIIIYLISPPSHISQQQPKHTISGLKELRDTISIVLS